MTETTVTVAHIVRWVRNTNVYDIELFLRFIDVTFSGGNFRPRVGETLRVKGTVKSHDLYRGEAQTTFTRCAIV